MEIVGVVNIGNPGAGPADVEEDSVVGAGEPECDHWWFA
jgi:hypothetical protein